VGGHNTVSPHGFIRGKNKDKSLGKTGIHSWENKDLSIGKNS
jgi:hypothetical protein